MNRRDLTTTKRNHLHIRKKKPKKIDKKKNWILYILIPLRPNRFIGIGT